MFEVRGLSASYGKHSALSGVDLDVGQVEIVVVQVEKEVVRVDFGGADA